MTRRKKRGGLNPTLLIVLLLVGVAIIAFMPFEKSDKPEIPVGEYEKVVMPAGIPNEMVAYEGFTVAFNPEMHQPNYVVWTLEPEEANADIASRKKSNFKADFRVKGCATLDDYKGSGFDRGHMCPAADMKWSQQAMDDCHYLTNICPQDKNLNGKAWQTVENNSRKWANKYGPLVIVCGPVLSDRMTRSIGTTPVPVPERFFKVILAPQAKMAVAFLMPNSYVEGGAAATAVSIDEVEAVTGFDFFSELPDDIENELESKNNFRTWTK